MKYVEHPPSEAVAFAFAPPEIFGGTPIAWRNDLVVPEPVFLREWRETVLALRVHLMLLGVRYDASLHDVGGHLVEFWMRTRYEAEGQVACQRLHQLGPSPVHSDSASDVDFVHLRKASRLPVLDRDPEWVDRQNRLWPLHQGQPMVFFRQYAVPVTTDPAVFAGGNMLYLFVVRKDERLLWRMTKQDYEAQSLEQHYRDEERRMRRRTHDS